LTVWPGLSLDASLLVQVRPRGSNQDAWSWRAKPCHLRKQRVNVTKYRESVSFISLNNSTVSCTKQKHHLLENKLLLGIKTAVQHLQSRLPQSCGKSKLDPKQTKPRQSCDYEVG